MSHPGKHKTLYNNCTTSAQRLRHWSDIVQMVYRIMFRVCWDITQLVTDLFECSMFVYLFVFRMSLIFLVKLKGPCVEMSVFVSGCVMRVDL